MASLPWAPNSGRCSPTGSSSSRSPRSHCCATATATLGFVIEHQTTIESGVMGIPARACPIPRSATAVPSIEHVQLGTEVQPALDARRTSVAIAPGTAPHPSRRSPPRPWAVTLVRMLVSAERRWAVGHDERRWTPKRPMTIQRDGHEPDIQLSFANERTFLAWERTALGLITAGLAITQLLPSFDFPGGRRLIGLPLIALGSVIAATSYWEWHRNQDAISHDRPLPRSRLPLIVAIVVSRGRALRVRPRDRRRRRIVSPARHRRRRPGRPTSAPTSPGTAVVSRSSGADSSSCAA